MKPKTILLTIIIILILTTLTFIFARPLITGRAIDEPYDHTYTRAICDEDNFCQDHEVICKDNKLIELKPITGAVVQHPENWEDPREYQDNLCE